MPLSFQLTGTHLPYLPEKYLPSVCHHLLLTAYHPLRRINLTPSTDRLAETEHRTQNGRNLVTVEAITTKTGISKQKDFQNLGSSRR